MPVPRVRKALRLGGVPEHFNLPWHRLLESGALREAGIDARWRDFHGGSGEMAAALGDGEVDVAMLLTEGAVAAIARGAPFRIVSWFTMTPLIWGIHVPARSALHTAADLRGETCAISRFGSGSHLMACVHARQRGWPVKSMRFEVVGNLAGARAALAQDRARVFFWEKFMTQPFVDNGEMRRVADYPAPWPGFVVCVRDQTLRRAAREVAVMLRAVQASAFVLTRDPGRVAQVAQRYGLTEARVEKWLSVTRWATRIGVHAERIATVARTLRDVGLIAPERDPVWTARLS